MIGTRMYQYLNMNYWTNESEATNFELAEGELAEGQTSNKQSSNWPQTEL